MVERFFYRSHTLIVIMVLIGIVWIALTRVQPQAMLQETRAGGLTASQAAAPAPSVGHQAPDFMLPALDSQAVSLGSLRGQVVLVNFWATWCPPCRAEMPAIESVYEHYRDRGLVVLAVNLKEDPQSVGAFMTQYRLTFPALLDSDGQVSSLYLARVLPSSFFLDRRGVVRAVYYGPMPRSVIVGMIEQLLGEEP